MTKICSENELLKRRYAFFLEAVNGKQSTTADAALKAIERFEIATSGRTFRKFHIEQVRAFRAHLAKAVGPSGHPLSAATIAATLKRLRDFFLWLSREPGFRSKINPNDVQHFTPTDQDRRIAHAVREKHVASLEDIRLVLSLMPARSEIELRDRALIAFTILTGARDGAIASFRLKHLNLGLGSLFHDAREVRTKSRKTFTAFFFPVGPEPIEIVSRYIVTLRTLGFGPDDPLFPSTAMGKGPDRTFVAAGLSRMPWSSAEPIRKVFRAAFARAGLPYANPHSFRNTLARLGERICHTPEEWKAWSQNLGHESEATTFVGYGHVTAERQNHLIKALGKGIDAGVPPDQLRALEALISSLRSSRNSA